MNLPTPPKVPRRFVQICSASTLLREERTMATSVYSSQTILCALDNFGVVWALDNKKNVWVQLPAAPQD